MNKLVVLAALMGVAASVPLRMVESSEGEVLFKRFKQQYKKFYFDDHDEQYRKGVFLANLDKIRAHNAAAEHPYTLAMNAFGDLTFEEFHASHTGFLGSRYKQARSGNVVDLSGVMAADSVDWSAKGAVTAIKDQGQCGSCWAFSTTGSVEGAWFIKHGDLVSLSEQQLMDCSKSEGNESCEGGLMDYAFKYIISNKGLCTEASYPYKEADEKTCKSCTTVAKISAYHDVATTEAALKTAVTQQPVSVAIEADQDAFQFYSSGVLTGTCGTNLDHGVLAVGFGTLNGVDYWKVKNSWGDSWGMKGYVLIERGGDKCGIHDAASYPDAE